ncbi:aminoacyl-tRNA deacylase [Thioalkalivibrio sp. ALE20]|uniref:aminoacyl-tRNA deacylase n=1 Tax=Thioalkalivibrio sp. ALE20 TaxID=545275 RepID=UPI00039DE307|nr:YbaK/EbsC family protein [Thioalkalivibrio sp. ALE20]
MTISTTLQEFLDERDVNYDVVGHPRADSASRTAEAAHVPGDELTKGVLVEDAGHYMLAVLPATRRLQFGKLHYMLGEHVGLATEEEVRSVFPDCEHGAVPALGTAWGLEVLLDESLAAQDRIYVEGGDHVSLIRLDGPAFRNLLGHCRHGDFSRHI